MAKHSVSPPKLDGDVTNRDAADARSESSKPRPADDSSISHPSPSLDLQSELRAAFESPQREPRWPPYIGIGLTICASAAGWVAIFAFIRLLLLH